MNVMNEREAIQHAIAMYAIAEVDLAFAEDKGNISIAAIRDLVKKTDDAFERVMSLIDEFAGKQQ